MDNWGFGAAWRVVGMSPRSDDDDGGESVQIVRNERFEASGTVAPFVHTARVKVPVRISMPSAYNMHSVEHR